MRAVHRVLPVRGAGGRRGGASLRGAHRGLRGVHHLRGQLPAARALRGGHGRRGVRSLCRRAAGRAHLARAARAVRGMAARDHGEAGPALAAGGREPHRQGRAAARRAPAAREPALLPGHDGRAPRCEHPHAAASALVPGRHVHLRHDRRAREAGHRRDICAVPQGGERRGRRPHGGRAPHAAAEEPPCHLCGAPGEDGAQARGGGGDGHARADDVAVHVHELLLGPPLRLPRERVQLHVRGGGAVPPDGAGAQHHVRLLRLPCGHRRGRGHDVHGPACGQAAHRGAGPDGAGEEGHPGFAHEDLRSAYHVGKEPL